MSKKSLLEVANVNLFKNVNEQIEFSLAKDERTQAHYSGYDKKKGYDVRGVRAKFAGDKTYIRLAIATTEDGKREYHNAALFVNEKKEGKQPDFTGSVNLTKEAKGPKLRLAAWKKVGEKAGEYLSISISEYLPKAEAKSAPAAPARRPSTTVEESDFIQF